MEFKENIFTTLHQIFDIIQNYHGMEYLIELSKNISIGLDIDYVLIGKINRDTHDSVTTDIIAHHNEILDNFTYELKGTPCDNVFDGQKTCTYLDHVAEHFPEDEILDQMGIRSYSGSLLKDDEGNPIGIFVLLSTKPMRDKKNINAVMNFFSARINAEMLKTQQQEQLKALNEELRIKNEQMKDLQDLNQTALWEYCIKTDLFHSSEEAHSLYELPGGKELSWRSILRPYSQDDRSRLKYYFNRCRKEGFSFCDTFKFKSQSGKERWIKIVGHIMKDEKGDPDKIVGALQDVTVVVNNQQDAISLKNELNHFEHSISKFLIVAKTDPRGIITYANDKFCEISGYKRAELIGKDHRIVNSDTHSFDFFFTLWNTIKSGNPWEGIICNKAKDGSLYWVQTFIFPQVDSKGNIIEYYSIRFDITDRIQLTEELNEEKERATFASQLAAVGELSAGIAHEIANPLTVISGNLLMLRKEDLANERKEKLINTIDRSVSRIGKIIKGLHNVAQKSRDDSFTLNSLETVLNNTLEFCEEALKKSHIELSVELPTHEVLFSCNDVKISQIVLNLINNAKDAINSSDVKEKWIKVRIEDNVNEILIKVIDSGRGIPEHLKSKVMETFFTTKKIGKGTGLGLSLVSRFAKEHNGYVDLTEEDGHTCFQVTFPKQVIDQAI
jgi:PAS domain S-box-containing protein